MDLSNIKPATGATHSNKRLGRGEGSGRGGTSTKGHKGHQSRSGYKSRRGNEGGQMPIARRLPKFGFNNLSRKEFKAINLSTLQALSEKNGLTAIDVDTLVSFGLVSKNDMIKILGKGKLTAKLDVKAHAFSKSAQAAIESLNGTAVKL
jgi:large subunit ribosomal protein L15